MAKSITISGLDECLRYFDEAPKQLVACTRKAMQAGSRQTTKMVRSRLPKRWSGLVKGKVSNKGHLLATIGMFNTHQAQGHQPANGKTWDWFKAYWLNYGTLDKRDPGHRFEQPVKHRATAAARRRKNTKGIEPRRFFETAISGYESVFLAAFNASLKKQGYDIEA